MNRGGWKPPALITDLGDIEDHPIVHRDLRVGRVATFVV